MKVNNTILHSSFIHELAAEAVTDIEVLKSKEWMVVIHLQNSLRVLAENNGRVKFFNSLDKANDYLASLDIINFKVYN